MIGIDILDVSRVEKIIDAYKMQKIFSPRELDYIAQKQRSFETIAGMFCAKEAFFKALGSGIVINKLVEVEVCHSKSGAPYYAISGELLKQNGIDDCRIELSISHTKNVAAAICQIENK